MNFVDIDKESNLSHIKPNCQLPVPKPGYIENLLVEIRAMAVPILEKSIVAYTMERGCSGQLLEAFALKRHKINLMFLEIPHGEDFTPGPYDIEIEDAPPIMASPTDIEL